jgi:lipid II:glycine glycyltransferase (peptidoglycan interpeptide bridge formation enzyme)
MRKGTRSSVRLAEKLGVDVRRSETPDSLHAFVILYGETQRRLARTKGVRGRQHSAAERVAALQELTSHGAARLYLAFMDGEPLAGCLFGVFGAAAYYLESGAVERARTSGAVHFALVTAIRQFVAEGYTRINLGGAPAAAQNAESADHGLYQFKLGLGTREVACTSGTVPVRSFRATGAALTRRLMRK